MLFYGRQLQNQWFVFSSIVFPNLKDNSNHGDAYKSLCSPHAFMASNQAAVDPDGFETCFRTILLKVFMMSEDSLSLVLTLCM